VYISDEVQHVTKRFGAITLRPTLHEPASLHAVSTPLRSSVPICLAYVSYYQPTPRRLVAVFQHRLAKLPRTSSSLTLPVFSQESNPKRALLDSSIGKYTHLSSENVSGLCRNRRRYVVKWLVVFLFYQCIPSIRHGQVVYIPDG